MNILVTGGAGFIGSHLTASLVADGHNVTVLDNLSTGNLSNLAPIASAITFVEGDILDANLVESQVLRADLVYHLAAAVGVGNIMANPLRSIITNTTGTEHVLSSCHRHSARVVVASTSEIYGKTPKLPMSEDDDRILGSTAISRWSYSTAKALDEHLALAYAVEGLKVSIVRYFNSYGPHLDEKGYGSVIANFIRQARAGEPLTVHGDGLQQRCFTFVADTVRGTILAGTRQEALGSVFNIGSNFEISIADLARLIIDTTGSTSTITNVSYEQRYGTSFEDTRRRVPSLDRARTVLGYTPTINLAEGLDRTLAWWNLAHT
ncbi:MAG: NAD-dependent epimerase/dehydratase family protein [Ilumatobacteraceae bacterium]